MKTRNQVIRKIFSFTEDESKMTDFSEKVDKLMSEDTPEDTQDVIDRVVLEKVDEDRLLATDLESQTQAIISKDEADPNKLLFSALPENMETPEDVIAVGDTVNLTVAEKEVEGVVLQCDSNECVVKLNDTSLGLTSVTVPTSTLSKEKSVTKKTFSQEDDVVIESEEEDEEPSEPKEPENPPTEEPSEPSEDEPSEPKEPENPPTEEPKGEDLPEPELTEDEKSTKEDLEEVKKVFSSVKSDKSEIPAERRLFSDTKDGKSPITGSIQQLMRV